MNNLLMNKKLLVLIIFGTVILLILIAYNLNQNSSTTTAILSLSNSLSPWSPKYFDLTQLKNWTNQLELNRTLNNQTSHFLLDSDPNELILAYVPLPLNYDYGSNLIPLTFAALIVPNNRDFLELGMGMFSTPLLHKIAYDQGRHIVSVDTDAKWVKGFLLYNETREHRIYLLGNREEEMGRFGLNRRWGLVLVDHIYGDRRPQHCINFAVMSDVVVTHDTERTSETYYKFEFTEMRKYFKYVCKFSLYTNVERNRYVSTTLMSNYIDLPKLLKPVLDKVKTEFGHESCDVNF